MTTILVRILQAVLFVAGTIAVGTYVLIVLTQGDNDDRS
jgi:hypothetical protein